MSDEIESLATETLDVFGSVHLVCNNAGIGGGGLVAGFDVEQWKRVIDTDLWSVLHGLRVFLPILSEQGEGHVVNTASVAGLFAPPFMGPYNDQQVRRGGRLRTAFNELAMFAPGVGISVLCPGWVSTNIAEAQIAEAEKSVGDDAAMLSAFGDVFRASGTPR